jgi:hypothetical protein
MEDNDPAFISPHYTENIVDLSSATIEDRVAILEDRIRGYITTPARLVYRIHDSSHLIVMLAVLSCIELIEVLHRGQSSRNKSRAFFKSGFRRLFRPIPTKEIENRELEKHVDISLDELYRQVRCGIFHTATTRSKVVLKKNLPVTVAIRYNETRNRVDLIEINPIRCLNHLDVALSEYFTKLRNPANTCLRSNFQKGWETLRAEE